MISSSYYNVLCRYLVTVFCVIVLIQRFVFRGLILLFYYIIIKFVGFESICYVINLDIILLFMIFLAI